MFDLVYLLLKLFWLKLNVVAPLHRSLFRIAQLETRSFKAIRFQKLVFIETEDFLIFLYLNPWLKI